MLDKLNNHWQWLIFLSIGILFPLRMAIAAGGIATDGTMGPAQTLGGKIDVDIEQNLGTTVGKNLFHSFSEFNVNSGQTVTFKESTPNALDNVISRVTGGSQSDINGTLRSTPDGHANLYLVNPSGVMFGKDARIDVPGAFHASTANEVRFQDGARFSASQPTGSTLTAAAPASFGFLGTSSATNGLLKVDGSQLAVGTGQKLDMVGRNISVENGAKLSASEGEVRLEAVGQRSMNIPLNQPSETTHGAISLTRSTIDASGEGGGKVIVRGRDLKMDQNALIAANTHGKQDGAGIDIRLTDDLNMKGGGRILAGTLGSGAAGNIHVKAKNLLIDGKTTINGQPLYLGTGISTETGDHTAAEKHSTGRAGDIELHIANRLSLIRGGQINSSSFSTGNAGNIMIKAGQLWIDRQGILAPLDILGRSLHSGIVTAALRTWSGKGGNIDVAVQRDINIKGGGLIEAGTLGNAISGNILVIAKNLRIDGLNTITGIGTEAGNSAAKEKHSTGRAGNIEVRIEDQLSLARSGQINASSFGTGDAGNVTVNVGQLLIDGQGAQNTGIFSSVAREWGGKGGNIDVAVQGDINIIGGGSLIQAGTLGGGASGNILVTAKNLRIDGLNTITGIGTEAGDNTVKEKHSTGLAGDIEVRIEDQLLLTQRGQINSSSFGTGDAGNVTVKAGQLVIDGQGVLADNLENSTGIFTASLRTWSGEGGKIAVTIRGDMAIKGGGTISADTYGTQNAGDITVSANQLTLEQDSSISTAAENSNGGNITINGGQFVQLINSKLITNVQGRQGNSGNITINAENLVMETGLIQANTEAFGGSAGNIKLNVKGLIPSGQSLFKGVSQETLWKPDEFGLNVIEAVAPNGISGVVQSTAPQLDLSGVLSNLGMPRFDTRAINQDYCSLGTGSSLIRQGKGGLPPRSRDSVMY